jgi:hypothetical protein
MHEIVQHIGILTEFEMADFNLHLSAPAQSILKTIGRNPADRRPPEGRPVIPACFWRESSAVRIVACCTPRWHWIPAPDKNIRGQACARMTGRRSAWLGLVSQIDYTVTLNMISTKDGCNQETAGHPSITALVDATRFIAILYCFTYPSLTRQLPK